MSTLAALRPLLTIKKDGLYKFIFFSFLFIGYLNAVLRLSVESNMTLFRVALPLMVIFSFFVFRSTMIKFFGIALLFLAYGIFNSLVMSRFGSFNVVYFLHYCTLIFLGLLTFSLIKRYGAHVVFFHLRTVYILMVGVAVLQFFFKFEIPNTYYRYTLNGYYWVENDLSTALAAFIPFLLAAQDKKILNSALAFAGIAIIVYNSSRIALLSIIFFIVFQTLNRFGRTGYIVSAVTVLVLFIIFRDYKLEGNTLYQLLIDPFQHVFTLTTYNQYGSIYDRTNALIFGLKELMASWVFGIGPGNATAMFEQPEYFLRTAQSMHNFIAHIIVEYGWLMLVMLFYFMIKVYNLRRKLNIQTRNDRLFYIYLVTVSLASLTQSEGLFSNYYFFVSLFSSVAYFGNKEIFNDSNFKEASEVG